MVLAIPGETTYFHNIIPAFDLKYIEDCFERKDYPDPTKYVYVSILLKLLFSLIYKLFNIVFFN